MGLAYRGLHFIAQGEYLVGIAQRQAAMFGQLQIAAALFEEFAPEPVFQQVDLAGKGLRGGVQLLAGPHHAAGFGGNPEVIEVLKVHLTPLQLLPNCRTERFHFA